MRTVIRRSVRTIQADNRIKVALFLLFGVAISLSWYTPDTYIARGDTYPKINVIDTLANSFYLWSEEHFGYFNSASLVIYHWAFWALLEIFFGGSLGQVMFYGIMMGGSMATMYVLTLKLFQHQFGALAASVFYVFNFFYVNNGMAQTVNYEILFIPLLMLLYFNIVEKIKKNENSFRASGVFILAGSILIPILYVNPAAAYVVILTMGAFVTYLFLTNQKMKRKIASNFAWILIVMIPALSWFVFGNYVYLNNSSASLESLQGQDWTWTHSRFTAENILRLDGSWAWTDYRTSEYRDYYSNPLLQVSSFFPMAVAFGGIALAIILQDKRHFLLICFASAGLLLPLVFLVNSTESFGSFVYETLPLSFLLREPYSKLTPVILVFMSILVAFFVSKAFSMPFPGRIASRLSKRIKTTTRYGLAALFLFLLLANGANLIGRAHLESLIIPGSEDKFSIQPKPPQYWNEASDWINNQAGNWKVLLLPNNDYYQLPYEWGYYGSDFVHFYLRKPVVMQYYYYTIAPETTESIGRLYQAISDGDHDTFKKLLDYYDIRLVVQRNDVIPDFQNRQILNNDLINSFLEGDPDLIKVKQFGRLDVYEYVGLSTPSSDAQDKMIEFDNFEGWDHNLKNIQHITINDGSDSQVLVAKLEGSPNVWAVISSPPITVEYYSHNLWQMNVEAVSIHQLHLKVNEYDKDGNFLAQQYLHTIGDGNILDRMVTTDFVPKHPDVSFVTLQIWYGYNAVTLPSILEVRNVSLHQSGSIVMVGSEDTNIQGVQQEKLNPTLYLLKSSQADTSSPTLLILNQGFDPMWEARVDGERIPSRQVSYSFNGFLTERSFSEVEIEFGPQSTFSFLLAFSISLLIIVFIATIRPSILLIMLGFLLHFPAQLQRLSKK